MSQRVSESREFGRGAARFHDLVYIITKGKALNAQGIAHVSLVGIDEGAWSDAFNTTWNATAVAVAKVPAEKVVLIGEDGDVTTYVGGKSTNETIKPPPVMIRNARTIGGEVYACGMKREVFRRTGEGRWIDMSAPRAAQEAALGFEAIDGYASDEIYACGWGGELWRYDGATWTACSSPTQTILTTVCCAGDGIVYAAGQGGVLLRGRNDAWAKVAWDEAVTADLWDLCWFGDKLYVATMTGLYKLEGNRLVPVNFGGPAPATCCNLTAAAGVMWSIGHADIASFDGTSWQHYT